jgi:hypothetical protein
VWVALIAGFAAGCVWPFGAVEGPGRHTGQQARQPAGPQAVSASTRPSVEPARERTAIGAGNEVVGAGVNAFLWRAALDTVSFMPLASADPYGGVIITDWRASTENPNERFKLTVYVLDPELRADAIKVAVFRQTLRVSGIWADAAVDPDSPTKIENAVLSRARQLRLRASVR